MLGIIRLVGLRVPRGRTVTEIRVAYCCYHAAGRDGQPYHTAAGIVYPQHCDITKR